MLKKKNKMLKKISLALEWLKVKDYGIGIQWIKKIL